MPLRPRMLGDIVILRLGLRWLGCELSSSKIMGYIAD